MIKFIFALLSALLIAQGAEAQIVTGNNLSEFCELNPNSTNGANCVGYIAGIIDMMSLLQDGGLMKKEFCPPAGATIPQYRDTIRKALITYPEKRHLPASAFVMAALWDAFPCPKH